MAMGVISLLCVGGVSGYSIGGPKCDAAGRFLVLQIAAEIEEVNPNDDTSTI